MKEIVYNKKRNGVLTYPFRIEKTETGVHVWMMKINHSNDPVWRSHLSFSELKRLKKWLDRYLRDK